MCRITTADFIKATQECVELFPTERTKTYYCESYRNPQNDSVAASGKFYSFYRTCRELFAAACFINISEEDLAQEINEGIYIF